VTPKLRANIQKLLAFKFKIQMRKFFFADGILKTKITGDIKLAIKLLLSDVPFYIAVFIYCERLQNICAVKAKLQFSNF